MQNLLLLVVITIASVYYCNSYQHIKKSLHNNYSIRFNNYYNNNKINNCNSHLEMSKVSSSWFESDDDLGDPSEIEDAFGMPVPPLPSVSSKINYGEETPNILYDLWVIGSGTLGELIVKRWKELYPDAKIIAETKTDKRHDSYLDMDVLPRLREIRSSEDIRAAKNVVICLPPSSSEDYVTEVSDGVSVWAGPSGGGSLLYTSSIGVYGESNGNTITESFRVDTRSKSSTK